jgi:mono/diheme cytochrome c family protein
MCFESTDGEVRRCHEVLQGNWENDVRLQTQSTLRLNPLPLLHRVSILTLIMAFVFCAACDTESLADERAASTDNVFYESAAQTIINDRCIRCHNAKTKKAGLDLSTPRAILQGSDSGRIVEAGEPDESLLFQMLEADEMPPDEKDRLSADQVAIISNWIAAGTKFRDDVQSGPEVTQHDIIPLLHLRCVACHGGRRQEAGLDLRTKQSILKGGKSGPAVVSGKPGESLLIRRIQSAEMPPRRKLVSVSVKPMETHELEKLSNWIGLGLPESEERPEEPLMTDEDRDFWSFQPPKRPRVPEVSGDNRIRNPIDAFVLRKLEERELSLSPDADRTTLLRRVCFDLTGLPPAPEEIDTFLNDSDPQAYEKLVDRLLESQRYGERWARHWLDIVGYADSEGAQNEDRVRPDMYRYRDYVIRAFNADKPYSRFLLEQIAGDELADYEQTDSIDQQLYDNLVATGFLRTAPDRTFANITNFVPDRLEVIADEMDILGTAVLGLTLKCARCHFHKFDPIPQRDYYRLTAIFKGAYDEHDWLKSQGPRTLPHVMTKERQAFEQHEQKITDQVETMKDSLRQKTEAAREEQFEKSIASLAADIRERIKASLVTPESERTEYQNKLLAEHARAFTIATEELRKLDPRFRTECETLEQQIKDCEGQRMPEPRIRALWSRGEPSPTYVLKRGNYLTPGRPVDPGVPAVLSTGQSSFVVRRPWENAKSTGRRLAFARWLTRPDHPLTARVMVNRIWQHHFGSGIVTTPGNFGKAGARPTHPELLDWLATEFVRSDWSVKALHRLIVTSSTYRQSSHVTDEGLRLDPDGSLLSRMQLQRMDAEVLRDTLLYVAGKLDESPFGPADGVDVRDDGLVTSKPSPRGWRRSIYILQRRTQIPTLLENYDYPQMGPNCIQRGESLVAPQALHLMNNKMVHQLAEYFADRVRSEVGDERSAQVESVFLRSFGRRPTPAESAAAVDALEQLANRWTHENTNADNETAGARQALITYCHAIMNLAEFLYVD